MCTDPTLTQGGEDLRRALERSREHMRPPTQVPGYEIERFLGSGAYGEVWVAVDRNTGRKVAVKFYAHKGGLDWSLLSREVEKLAFMFADRYVVQLIDVGWEANPPYYVMEYLERGSLEDRLREGPLAVSQAVSLFRDVGIGLVHSHGKGVLHCDLKPANVLLDQDLKPRLADFGQSRLSHEQTPALGTLFYMAPEQADLSAVPDARWDVYALGALLYRMLVGEPPFKSDELTRRIETADGLPERLKRYREGIALSPRPDGHRQVPGIDRPLIDIIDRCLAVNPHKRFANVQTVLDALEQRSLQRARRPLLIFGVLGPVLLLAIMTFYAWSTFRTVVDETDLELSQRSLQTNRFAARFVAETVARQVDRRWLALEQAAADPKLLALFARAAGPENGRPTRDEWRAWMKGIAENHANLTGASWFISDSTGQRLARFPRSTATESGNFASRDYFHGQGKDYPDGTVGLEPIHDVHRSMVFESKSTKNRVTGFSAPVWSGPPGAVDRRVLGVITMTVELGKFAELRSDDGNQGQQIAVLVDAKQDDKGDRGSILEHPYLAGLLASPAAKKADFHLPPYHVDGPTLRMLDQLQELKAEGSTQPQPADERLGELPDYSDPIGRSSAGDQYSGRWLAAAEPVTVDGRPANVCDTGWFVIVQERHDAVSAPVRQLGDRLVRKGLLALGVVLGVVTALWGFVIVVLTESSRSRFVSTLRKSVGFATQSLGMQSGSSVRKSGDTGE